VGRKSLVTDIFGMRSSKEFVNTFEDIIRRRGIPDKLIADGASVQQSKRVLDIMRALIIKAWYSEPNYQHQNPSERRWRDFKGYVNWIMNHRDVSEDAWLLCCEWVADVMNHTAERSIGWKTPLEVLTGQTTDISIILVFLFWDVVYVARYNDAEYTGMIGSKKSSEIRGRFVGFSWNVGHALTFKILTDDTKKVISRSVVRLAKDGENNLKLDLRAPKERSRTYIMSKNDSKHSMEVDLGENPFLVGLPESLTEEEADQLTEDNADHLQAGGDTTQTRSKDPDTTDGAETSCSL